MSLSPRFTAVSWLLVGIFVLAGLAATPWEASAGDTADYLRHLADNSSQAQISAVLLHFGYLFLVPALFGLYWQMRDTPGRLRTAGGVLAVFGAIGLSGMLVVDFYGLALAQSLPAQQAIKIEEAAQSMGGSVVIRITTLLPLALGLIMLLVAAFRAKLLPLWSPLVLVASLAVSTAGPPAWGTLVGVGLLAVAAGLSIRLLGGDRGNTAAIEVTPVTV